MTGNMTEQDFNSYIDALLFPEAPYSPHSESAQNHQHYLSSHIDFFTSKEPPQTASSSPILPPTIANTELKGSSLRPNGKCKDYLKNMYNNSLKFIVKRYISCRFQKKVDSIHRRLGIPDSHRARLYYEERQEETIGLTNLRDLLNFEKGTDTQKLYKKAFHAFYVWYMRRVYPIHILRTAKLQHADVYWRAKNVLVYLPRLRTKQNILPSCSDLPLIHSDTAPQIFPCQLGP